jgi:type I restriction enzyme R subunit
MDQVLHNRTTERMTQDRVIALFQNDLGYEFLGDWHTRPDNSNVEKEYLTKFLKKKGYSHAYISRVTDIIEQTIHKYDKTLYERNKQFYSLLRYGVTTKVDASKNNETIPIIDWKNPENNHFAIAEEVTIVGRATKRPDIVLYINGIALVVLELKSSQNSIKEGIRQSITNQQKEFIEDFFTTVQLILAGNDTEGLRYGAIKTAESYYLSWKEDEATNEGYLLDKYLKKLCNKKRLLEIIYDFILFDAGVKKLPRPHQYFGVKKAQEFVGRKEGGIIWHTQGSGKSILMVVLAKWILENNPNARVAIVTDRDELDKQISRVFNDVGEQIHRASSGRDLIAQLGKAKPRLLCSLVHKFGRKDEEDFDEYLESIKNNPIQTMGEIYVFVDEAHRTQSGKLHLLMKAILKDAIFIGFTGTPLLQKDKKTTHSVFGRYIHTYKFNEAIEDKVVLDLMYEARDIDQKLSSPDRVDAWFEGKTKGLNSYQKKELMNQWGTMQRVLSSKPRMEKIIADIELDFVRIPILSRSTGNAILVSGSIYEAFKYYKLLQDTRFKGKCAVVTSYNPQIGDIRTEDTGESTETDKQFVYNTCIEMLNGKDVEVFETEAKKAFIETPSQMKLLIVVDKLLTGFDAPKCSYIYLDKKMQDHGLFQAICRVNRLASDEKQFGFIVDYKDLFKKVEDAIGVYTSEIDHEGMELEDCQIELKHRLVELKKNLDNAIEKIDTLCEPVQPPKNELNYIQYFCGNPENSEDLGVREYIRVKLYEMTAKLVRAYSNISSDLDEANVSKVEQEQIKKKVTTYISIRNIVKRASGEIIDLKSYEADMRHLLDTYIQAEDSRKISPFDDIPLLDLIEKLGIQKAINDYFPGMNPDEESAREAVAETIENNVRKKIIRDQLLDPEFYSQMSDLLKEVIADRKAKAISYENYLKRIYELSKKVNKGNTSDSPSELKTPGSVAIYNNLGKNLDLAIQIHESVLKEKPDSWRGNIAKENTIKGAIYKIVKNTDLVEKAFKIIYEQSEY